MQPAEWWLLQAASLTALLLCTYLAYASAGRIGRQTPYGGFLFTIALGFWFLTAGLAIYIVAVALDTWQGPPGWGDLFQLTGWALLVLAFYLLLWRFSRRRYSGRQGIAPALVAPLFVGATFAALAWYRVAGFGYLPDAEGAVRMGYLFLNGVMIAVFAASFGVLRRLSRSSLATLFIFLGVALVLKTAADLIFLAWPRHPPMGLFTTALYPLGGAVAVIGLANHHRAIGRIPERRILADPSLVPSQLVFRDGAARMRDLTGELGEQLVLTTGRGVLTTAGYPAHIHGGILVASAPTEVWSRAVTEAHKRLEQALGASAAISFIEIAKVHGLPLLEGGTA